ncbi:MAG TPA: vWA domain-containing protein [Candidatus Binatia bacterium]
MKNLNEKGYALIFVTLSFVILGLFVGLATDGGRGFLLRAELERTVDAAAIAGAAQLGTGGISAAQAAACDAAGMNGVTTCSNLVVTQVTVNDASGNPKTGVQVTGTASTPTIFMRLGKLIGCGAACDFINAQASAVAASGGTVDLIMNLDNTGSMAGAKISNAKIGANAMVNAVLPAGGSSTALVSMVPFQGCYRSSTSGGCVDFDEYPTSGGMIVSLTNDATRLHNGINALSAPGGSGTNVCNGLKKTRQKLFQSGVARPNALKFLILLTDAENNFQTGLPAGTVDPACVPNPATATNSGNLNLGVRTNSLATEIKTPTVAADGQTVGETVKLFVIMYGPNATGAVPANCNAGALTSGTVTSQSYTKNLARCIASTAGDLYLAPNATDISAAFQQIISRLPVLLLN